VLDDVEHLADAVVHVADEQGAAGPVEAEGEVAGGRALEAHLLLEVADDDAVAVFAEAALAGCEQLCVDPTAAQDLVRLRALIASVNLGTDPSYDQHFVDQLLLKPLNLSRRPSATAEPGFRELPC